MLTAAEVRIAPLKPRHRARVAELLQSTGAFRAEEVDVALQLFDEGVGSALDDGRSSAEHRAPSSYTLLGAITPGGELAGYACYGPTPGCDRTYDLYWLATDPAWQSGGIGTRLLNEVEATLEGQHARLLIIETSSRSEYAPTRAFYERRGYTEAARVREFYASSDDRIILVKRISPATGPGAIAS